MTRNSMTHCVAWLAAWLFLSASAALAAEPKCLVFIIFDSSPGTRYMRKEMLAVAEGTLAELKPDDRLWVIAGHPSRGRLLLVGTMSHDDQLIREAKEKLKGIKTKLFWPSDLAAAFAAPLEAIRQGKAKGQGRVLIIVITDGRLSATRTRNLLSVADKAKGVGANVIVTGVKDTSPGILAAAAEDRIQWTLLSKCDPSTWLAHARQSREAGTAEAKPSSTGETPGLRDVVVVDNRRIIIANPQQAREGSVPFTGKPSPAISDARREGVPQSPGLSAEPKSLAPKSAEPFRVPETVEPAAEPEDISPSVPALFLKELLSSKWRLVGVTLVGLLSIPAVLLARDYSRAARQKGSHQDIGLKRSTRERALAAVVNGLEYSLGSESGLRRVRIGRDAGNSVVLNSRDVERSHVELTRKKGAWLLTNLSGKPIEVNSVTVPGRGKHAIFFPALIKLSPTSSVRLLLRPLGAKGVVKAAGQPASDDRAPANPAQPAVA